MKKTMLSMVTLSLLSSSMIAADSLESAFKEGKVSGQIRTFWIERDYSKSSSGKYERDGTALGGKFGFETAPLYGISAGAVFYTSNKLDDMSALTATSRDDKTLFANNGDSYTLLGQAYLQAKLGNTSLKIGRQQLDTPMAGSDDARMIPNLFEAAVVTNTDIKDLTVVAAHVWNEAIGSFSNGYAGNKLAAQAGYGLGIGIATGSDITGKFTNMGTVALNKSTDGVVVVAGIYKGIPNLTLQVWDYYAFDIANILYAQADYTMNVGIPVTLSGQYISEKNIGANLAATTLSKSKVDASMYGLKLAVKPIKDLMIYGAYTSTGSNTNAALNGGIFTPWGGSPSFAQGTVTRLGYVADTTAWKVGASYDIIPGLNFHTAYSKYTLGTNRDLETTNLSATLNGKDATAQETDWDITYKPSMVKNLELKLRGIYAKDFKPGIENFSEYRLIANYNF